MWSSVEKIYILEINTSIVKHIAEMQVHLLHIINILVSLPEGKLHINEMTNNQKL